MERRHFLKRTSFAVAGLCCVGNKFLYGSESITLQEETYPIVIVGSGYGGAVAALRLCEAGKKVVLLEMGLNWEKSGIPYSSMLKPGRSAAWLRKQTIAPFLNIFSLKPFTGALDRMDFENIKIWMGRGVGGGSLVNGGMAVLPKESYFKEVLPLLDTSLFYKKYFPLVQKELAVNIIDEEFLRECSYYQFARVGELEAKKAGFSTIRVPNVYDFNYMKKEYRKEVPASALAGEVIYGNNHGKNSLDKTYLKKAMATGNLSILDLHEVKTIEEDKKGGYKLSVHQINTTGAVVAKKHIYCRQLVLAAGTMGTLQLLLKSAQETRLPVNEWVGKEWGNNGNYMTGRNWVKPFSGGTGRRQATIPVAGVDNWNDATHPFFAEIAPLPMGMDVATALYLLINRVNKKGTVSYNAHKQKLALDWGPSNTADMRSNADYFIKKMNRANGGTRSHLLFRNGFGPDICYHPLGGAVLGSATDLYGRLKGLENLFIMDGSLIPGTIGVNPFLAITAVAEYCMENLLQQKAFELNI